MDRKDDRDLAGDGREAADRVAEQRTVDQGRAVQCDEQEIAAGDTDFGRRPALRDPLVERDQRVDHRVADEPDPPITSATPSAARFSAASSQCV